jgi:hypothetical protein
VKESCPSDKLALYRRSKQDVGVSALSLADSGVCGVERKRTVATVNCVKIRVHSEHFNVSVRVLGRSE